MRNNLQDIKDLLGAQGHFWTRARSAVLGVLTTHRNPLRAEEIHRALRGSRINLSSVYRALRLFHTLRIVRRVELGEGVARYELADDYRAHHHHLVCDACGRIEDVAACPVDEADFKRQIRRRNGFAVRSHTLELFGLCRSCQREVR